MVKNRELPDGTTVSLEDKDLMVYEMLKEIIKMLDDLRRVQ